MRTYGSVVYALDFGQSILRPPLQQIGLDGLVRLRVPRLHPRTCVPGARRWPVGRGAIPKTGRQSRPYCKTCHGTLGLAPTRPRAEDDGRQSRGAEVLRDFPGFVVGRRSRCSHLSTSQSRVRQAAKITQFFVLAKHHKEQTESQQNSTTDALRPNAVAALSNFAEPIA